MHDLSRVDSLVDYLTLKALRHFLELEQNQVFLGAGGGKPVLHRNIE